MKAAVCYAFGEPLVVEEVEVDAPRAGEVKVRLAATAICHSDLHLLHGDWGGALPVVAGHEAAGIVEELGEGVTDLAVGDRVVISLLRSCGRCFHCIAGSPHNCDGVFPMDAEGRMRSREGKPLQHGGIRTAAFAEMTVVDCSQVVRIASDIPLDRAALLGCGVVTGVGAVLNSARVQPGESVVVIGAGGVGLNSVQGAVLAGASTIVAIDRVEAKLAVATAFGATHVLGSGSMEARELVRAVRKLTGRGADHVLVTVGIPELVSQAQLMLRPGGTVTVVGMPPVKAALSLRMFDLVWSDQRIIGSKLGATKLQEDVPRLVEHYRNGRLQLDALITARYPLEQINDAMVAMSNGETLRNVIVF